MPDGKYSLSRYGLPSIFRTSVSSVKQVQLVVLMSERERMTQRLGDSYRVFGSQTQLKRLGLCNGTWFQFSVRVSNILRAHQLIRWSEVHDHSQTYNGSNSGQIHITIVNLGGIFRAHFEEEL